jgi:tetratricopeptide (TPR) repeat protein
MMGSNRKWLWCLLALALVLQGCWRDPETVKRRYVESGDKYFSQGKFKEASLMYRSALRKDARYGEAYEKLGEAELRRGEVLSAISAFRRAVELLPKDETPAGRLGDIYLAIYATPNNHSPRMLDEIKQLSDGLLKKNQYSYNGLRLAGFVSGAHASESAAKGDKEGAQRLMAEAIGFFQKADQVKPNQPDLLFATAQALAKNDQWDQAEALARRIIDKNPRFAPAYDFLMVGYLRRNRQPEAEQMLAQKIKNNPQVVEFVIQQAAFYYATNRRPQAEQVLQALLGREKDLPNARIKVGDFYGRMRDFDKALAVFNDGYKQGGARASEYRVKAALVLVGAGRRQEALRMVEAILKDDPKNNAATSMHATLELESGEAKQTQNAIADLQSLIGREPNNAVVRYNLARAYQSRNDLEGAKRQYEEAVKLRKGFLAAWIGLSQVSLAKGEFAHAIEAADKALAIDPSNVLPMAVKANAMINSGNLQQARADLQTALTKRPNSPDLEFQLALVSYAERKFGDAEKIFRALLEKYPNDPRLNFATADVLLNTNRGAQALELLQGQLKRAPDNMAMHYAVGATAMRTRDYDVAEREFRMLLGRNPKNLEIYMRLGETLRERGQLQQAIEVLRQGQAIDAANPMANLQLAMTLESAGMRREAMPLYANVLKKDGGNWLALNNIAYLMAEEGHDLNTALTYAQKAKQQAPSNDEVSDTLGWVYIQKKMADNALGIFKDLVKRNPTNAGFRYHLGYALYIKGDIPSAKQSLQAARGLKPNKEDDAHIRELLAKIG